MKRYTVPNLMHSLKVFVCFLIVMPYFGSSLADVVIPREERVTTRLIVREGSSTKTPEVGELRIGEHAEFLESVPRWRKVRLADNTVGFVSKAYSLVIPTPPPSATMRIHTFNVGTGACTLIECPGTDAPPLFVECGQDVGGRSENTLDFDTAKVQIEQILSNHTVTPNVVVTHAHNDHYNWLPRILGNTNTSRIWLGGVLTEYDNNEMDTWLTNQEANGAVINDGLGQLPPDWHNDEQALDQKLSCGLASTFVLTTNSGSTDSSKSMVLMIEYENFRAIFPGDAQKKLKTRQSRILGMLRLRCYWVPITGQSRRPVTALTGSLIPSQESSSIALEKSTATQPVRQWIDTEMEIIWLMYRPTKHNVSTVVQTIQV